MIGERVFAMSVDLRKENDHSAGISPVRHLALSGSKLLSTRRELRRVEVPGREVAESHD